ncbi:hypothetical protein CEXT_112961 [Caerostris extrusa]|uniref:Uncharacterized protein n=1 Tax=Caerostris extrusa TaxID=172846 RepID=A0AAV4Q7B1_CAEEX|nr:hypothetical protein CEXT_112961 [Caerostris extrusa]
MKAKEQISNNMANTIFHFFVPQRTGGCLRERSLPIGAPEHDIISSKEIRFRRSEDGKISSALDIIRFHSDLTSCLVFPLLAAFFSFLFGNIPDFVENITLRWEE